MLFWVLAISVTIFALLRFKTLQKNMGTLKAALVLSLRLAAVACAALIASPLSIPSHETLTHPTRIAILVDASRSTDTPLRRQTVEDLKRLLLNRTESVLVWEFGEDLRPVPLEGLSETKSDNASRLSAAIRKIVETVQPDELLVITDAQDTEPQPDHQILESLRKSKTRFSAVLLPTNLPPNLIVSVSPSRLFLFAGESANFTVKVEGERIREGSTVRLRVWDSQKLVLQTLVKLTKGATQVPITVNPQKSAWNRFRFELLPLADEAWTEDNYAEALVWQAPTKLRVLMVTGPPNFEFKFVKQALENEPNFEWVAIASLPDGTRYQQGSPPLLPASLQRLDPFHVAIVLAPTPDDFGITEGKAAWQFAQEGGGLLLTLSEPTVSTNGWRFFLPELLTISQLKSPIRLNSVKWDLLGERIGNLPEVDSAWSVRPRVRGFNTALEGNDEPVLIWWQEGLGKVAVLGIDGTWKWVMEAAKRGEQPKDHHRFWQALVRFLADPMKGTKSEMVKESSLQTPKPPPLELNTPPNPKRLQVWVKETGGQMLTPNEIPSWLKNLRWAKDVTASTNRKLSELPLPFLLLLAALSMEWWLVRRSGLT